MLSRSVFVGRRLYGVVVFGLALVLSACSANRGYTDPSAMTTQSLPPLPPTGMVREPARPYGDGYSLGSNYQPPRSDEYRWNGDPTRKQEGSTPPHGAPPPPILANNGQRIVAVRPGDTLYSLSRQYGVSVAALAEHNRLTTTAIHSGQTLVLPPTAP